MRFEETLGLSHILKLAEHELRQQIDVALAPLGLSGPQYAVLSVLEAGDQLTNAEIARRCSVTPQTMIKMMKALESQGFVHKSADASHGLKMNFTLTAAALRAVCDAHLAVNDLELKMVKGLKKKEIQHLLETLERCRLNLAD